MGYLQIFNLVQKATIHTILHTAPYKFLISLIVQKVVANDTQISTFSQVFHGMYG